MSTMQQPKVSVIIPVYNSSEYLARSISSIQKQTLKNIEIVCVDDSSTDNSLSLLQEICNRDSRVKVYSVQHGGASVCRNYGLDIATGEFVYFMDSDDVLDERALERCYECAVSHKLDVVLFNGITEFQNKKVEAKFWFYKSIYKRGRFPNLGISTGDDLFNFLYRKAQHYASPCLFFLSRSYLNGIGFKFFEGIVFEDNIASLQWLLNARRVLLLNETYFRRQVREHSVMTSKRDINYLYSYFRCIDCIYNLPINCSKESRQCKDVLIYFLIRRFFLLCDSLKKKGNIDLIYVSQMINNIQTIKKNLEVNYFIVFEISLIKLFRRIVNII